MPRQHFTRLAALALPFAVAMVLIPAVPDVDLWGHVRFGGDIVRARAIPALDPYSFTADLAWINHEWLSEVVMYGAYAVGGPAGLTLLRLGLIGLMLVVVAWSSVLDGVQAARIRILVAFVALLTYPRTEHVRPQLFSILLFAVLLFLIRACERGARGLAAGGESPAAFDGRCTPDFHHGLLAPMALAPPLMALWVNLHGGWVVGMGVLVLWAFLTSLRPRSTWRVRGYLALVVATSVAATLLNPYGARLWSFVWDTVGVSRPDITEWLPITRVQTGVAVMWCATALAFLAALRQRPGLVPIALVAALGMLSFRVSRLDAFFCLAVFVLMAPQLGRVRPPATEPQASPALRPSFAGSHPARTAAGGFGILVRGDAMLAALAVLCAAMVRWPAIAEIDLAAAPWLPEPGAIQYLTAHGVRGKMLTYFDWGEYAIWYLAPGVKVSMDGRRETVYSEQPIDGHLAVFQGRPDALAYIRSVNPDYVWLPKSLPVMAKLQSTGEWTTTFDGPMSAVLARTPQLDRLDPGAPVAGSEHAGSRFFPGP